METPTFANRKKQQADNDRNNNNNERAQDSRTPRVGQSRVAILGDSMLKQINARRIQQGMKHKIVVKPFPVDESDDEINILSQSRLPKNRNQSEPPRHTIRSNEDKRHNYSAPRKQQADNDRNNNNNERAQDSRRSPRVGQSRVAILGDSMLKQINARRIQQGMKHKIVVKTFPGAGIKEMNHYVKPTLLTAPNKLILHVGTNDLQRMTPDELLTHVQKLGESITRENGNIELVLSEIITRNDDKTLADKVNEYNKGLAQLCIERNWCLIRHNNIDVNHLNNYGLHLNKQGTSVLAKNIKQFLNRN
ncbi:Scavenger receptor cysteine-rich type 1 M130 [Paramuricea clavata]|uniref:Scavenger receptor cysteine-rich type 1 M130 n=1 Tax=Paramuricea clavata TaxID=317549 RepID=A0A7D9IJL6_PARCT|nr:Scavenger receptor cysteine-rich type 1 M130 [Paramuricea clavata]